MLIKNLPANKRPVEKIIYEKDVNLKELLAVLIGSGTKGKDVFKLSEEVISVLENKGFLSYNNLRYIKGLGKKKIARLIAGFNLGKVGFNNKKKYKIFSAKDVFLYTKEFLSDLEVEVFCVLILDSKNNIIKRNIVTKGILNASLVHPREVFKEAIRSLACQIILVHNHPSGDPSPSQEDIRVTNILREAGELLDIPVLDHVIVGDDSYWSFDEHER